jgi:large subunit ribosomal protein L5
MENEFHRYYKERVMPALQKLHGYKNVHQVPKVEKVVINTSIGSQSDVKQALEEAKAELALITGQRPLETLAKKSISNFKLRKDQAIGAKVTLRGERMYEFLERFIKAALPRIPSEFRINRFSLKSSSIKSSATSDLMLQSLPRLKRTRKPNRS